MGPMGGHRRDQSDSHMPLQSSDDCQELRVRKDWGANANGAVEGGDLDVYEPGQTTDDCERASLYNCSTICTRSEVLKTAVAFLCLMVSAFLNFFLLTVIHDVVPNVDPLPDLVFMVMGGKQQKWAWVVSDVLSTMSSLVSFVCIMLHKDRLVVLRRVLLLGAIMYGLRAVVLGVTFLPASFNNRDEICQDQVNRTNRTAMYATEVATRFVTYVVTLGLTSGQDKILCGDLMFSGHTVVFSIMYFVQLQYTPRRLAPLRVVMTPVTYLGIAALVVSGGHYSMDVLIAYWLTSHVFWTYHQIFELPRGQRANAPLSRLWWFWLCYWFESDVPEGRLANEWTWPFSRPAIFVRKMQDLNDSLQ